MWTFKSVHMVNRESLWAMVAVAQNACVACARWPAPFTVASGSDAIQMCRKMRAAVDLASSWTAEGSFRGRCGLWSVGVLVGITGGWAGCAAWGKSTPHLSLWHAWTDTDRHTHLQVWWTSKGGRSTKEKSGGWKLLMKRIVGICFDILHIFLL